MSTQIQELIKDLDYIEQYCSTKLPETKKKKLLLRWHPDKILTKLELHNYPDVDLVENYIKPIYLFIISNNNIPEIKVKINTLKTKLTERIKIIEKHKEDELKKLLAKEQAFKEAQEKARLAKEKSFKEAQEKARLAKEKAFKEAEEKATLAKEQAIREANEKARQFNIMDDKAKIKEIEQKAIEFKNQQIIKVSIKEIESIIEAVNKYYMTIKGIETSYFEDDIFHTPNEGNDSSSGSQHFLDVFSGEEIIRDSDKEIIIDDFSSKKSFNDNVQDKEAEETQRKAEEKVNEEFTQAEEAQRKAEEKVNEEFTQAEKARRKAEEKVRKAIEELRKANEEREANIIKKIANSKKAAQKYEEEINNIANQKLIKIRNDIFKKYEKYILKKYKYRAYQAPVKKKQTLRKEGYKSLRSFIPIPRNKSQLSHRELNKITRKGQRKDRIKTQKMDVDEPEPGLSFRLDPTAPIINNYMSKKTREHLFNKTRKIHQIPMDIEDPMDFEHARTI